jgi:DNA-binding FadR family transcriptional regulator
MLVQRTRYAPLPLEFELGCVGCLGEIPDQLWYWSSMKVERPTDPLLRLRVYVREHHFTLNDRLPSERELCAKLDLKRTALRKAMAVLEDEGQVWRQVGRGTFIGARPVLNLTEVKYLSNISSPLQIIDARLTIEPELARLAAKRAVATDLVELTLCKQRCREAKDWRVFESWDNRFHYAIAAATRNKLLMTLFETLNAVRRSPVWQTVRADQTPSPGYTTFSEHDAVNNAIARHEPQMAADAMRAHLISVRTRLISRNATPYSCEAIGDRASETAPQPKTAVVRIAEQSSRSPPLLKLPTAR